MMNAERFRRVEEIFHNALALSANERKAYLTRECGDDYELRSEAESLLALRTQAEGFLESSDLNATMTTPPGRQFGSYRILSSLGAGGMGEVYRAHDSRLGRDVAIKTLPREFASDPLRLARFRREARTLASLNHPNIAAIYGLEESAGATGLILELVEGETLQAPLPVPNALEYARQIAEGLEAAHKKGIVHRDLKPANVKVTPDGRVKILDFGLAKAVWAGDYAESPAQLSTAAGVETVTGHILGTPPYMSPEQARGEQVDKRTDILAFGCVLYELLSGKRAFQGETTAGTVQAILEREPDWTALPPKTPPKIVQLLKRCLQKDTKLRIQDIRDARRVIEKVQKGRNLWAIAAAGAGVVALLAAGAGLLLRSHQPAGRDRWAQLTNFADSVGQPALSPDGRMLTFIRGPGTFFTAGQVYVKLLPDGEPRQLTRDEYRKMSPAFSPDGSQIAYTTVDSQFNWDTWLVPVQGGESRLWLPNASGLVWIDPRRLLFSEIRKGMHMAIVTAEPSRAGARDVYLPAHERGMGHRSYPSPDGKWALVVEMDRVGAWVPCRLVPIDGSSQGRQVGPPDAGCTFGAWSPDGKWIYLTSDAGGVYHVWRQRFPDGEPEQVTSGLTQEEGIAMAPDGSSFITAVALKQRPAMVHDARGDRQISLEGYAYNPRITPDGKKVCYLILKGSTAQTGTSDLWLADLETGRNELLFMGLSNANSAVLGSYDISPDGKRVLVQRMDGEGKQRLWLAPLDRRSPPRLIPGVEGHNAIFGPQSEIFFRAIEGNSAFVYRVREDGTGLRKAIEQPVISIGSLSPDGQWLVAGSPLSVRGQETALHPLSGGPATRIWRGGMRVHWSPGGQSLFMSVARLAGGGYADGKTYVVPLPLGRALPDIPPGGFQTEEELARLPGVRVIDAADVNPGPAPDFYAYSREATQRNLYRVALR